MSATVWVRGEDRVVVYTKGQAASRIDRGHRGRALGERQDREIDTSPTMGGGSKPGEGQGQSGTPQSTGEWSRDRKPSLVAAR